MFLLGPSHHYYTPKCALSRATVYKTPLGDLPIDLEGIAVLFGDKSMLSLPVDPFFIIKFHFLSSHIQSRECLDIIFISCLHDIPFLGN